MRQVFLIVASALALGGCNVAEAVMTDNLRTINRVDLDKAQIVLMQEKVRASLKDPASAQFGAHVAGVNKDGVVMVCGLVNAKNGFGGYTGMGPFAGAFEKGSFAVGWIDSGSRDKIAMGYQLCAAQGLPLPG